MKWWSILLSVLLPASAHALQVPGFASAGLVLGQPDFTTADAAPASATSLKDPSAVVVDPATGRVFVADSGHHRVLRYPSAASLTNGAAAELVFGDDDLNNGSAGATAINTLKSPCGLWIDQGGRLWVSDTGNHRVVMYANAATITGSGPDAALVLGQPDATSEGSATSKSRLASPLGIAVDAAGRLWVADSGNHRVLRFDDAANTTTGSAAAEADGVLGQGNSYDTRNEGHDQLGFSEPTAVSVDSTGTLWVADHNNNRVLGFPSAATVSNNTNAARIAGQPDFITISAATSAIKLSGPTGVFADSAGGLWVLDQGNNRAVYFADIASLNINEPASIVVGQASFTENGSSLDSQHLDRPFLGLFAEPNGSLWLSDLNHHRVLRFGALDNLPPTIQIKGKAKVITSKKRSVIRGTAGDDVGVTTVTLQIGRKKVPASGTASWKKAIRLKSKRTIVKAYAFDGAGNGSSMAKVVVVRKPKP